MGCIKQVYVVYQLPDPMSATFSVMLCICECETMGGGGGMRWVEIVLVVPAAAAG